MPAAGKRVQRLPAAGHAEAQQVHPGRDEALRDDAAASAGRTVVPPSGDHQAAADTISDDRVVGCAYRVDAGTGAVPQVMRVGCAQAVQVEDLNAAAPLAFREGHTSADGRVVGECVGR